MHFQGVTVGLGLAIREGTEGVHERIDDAEGSGWMDVEVVVLTLSRRIKVQEVPE